MKTFLTGGIAATALLALTMGGSQAAVISHDLNTIINGGSSLSSTASFGTITISDNATDANKLDFSINLVGTGEKALSVYLNYNDATFSNSSAFVFTGGVTTRAISENSQQADGYTAGKFDIQTPATGNGGFEPLNFTVALSGTDLNPSMFDFTDTSGKLFAAVHIGNCGASTCTPGATGEASIWVGAGPSTSVPEPGSLMLLASGLLPLAFLRRRQQRP
jgi:hypothetical protein